MFSKQQKWIKCSPNNRKESIFIMYKYINLAKVCNECGGETGHHYSNFNLTSSIYKYKTYYRYNYSEDLSLYNHQNTLSSSIIIMKGLPLIQYNTLLDLGRVSDIPVCNQEKTFSMRVFVTEEALVSGQSASPYRSSAYFSRTGGPSCRLLSWIFRSHYAVLTSDQGNWCLADA